MESNEQAQIRAQREQERAEYYAKAMASFPFELVETSGKNALATWEELKKAGRGAPVILGNDLDNIVEPFNPQRREKLPSVIERIAAAGTLNFPDGLFKMRRAGHATAVAALRATNPSVTLEDIASDPPLGEWPAENSGSPGLSVAYDLRTGEPSTSVYIALVPTADPTTIPAHLQWGGWNECPSPEFHVAALRDWGDRYGAELVGLGSDTINLRVRRKPSNREEAIELARVQYAYCNDIIDQGLGSYRALAGELLAHDWWYFWWD